MYFRKFYLVGVLLFLQKPILEKDLKEEKVSSVETGCVPMGQTAGVIPASSDKADAEKPGLLSH